MYVFCDERWACWSGATIIICICKILEQNFLWPHILINTRNVNTLQHAAIRCNTLQYRDERGLSHCVALQLFVGIGVSVGCYVDRRKARKQVDEYACVCVCLYTSIFKYIFIYVYVYIDIIVCVHVYIRICICIHIYIYRYI